jgi:methyl-accepting chemotaxis protein
MLPTFIRICLIAIVSSGYFSPLSLASSNQQAIDRFEKNTQAIVARANNLSHQQLNIMDDINQIMDESQSAIAVLQSDNIPKLQASSTQIIAVAREYLTQYQGFLAELDKSSTCYQAEAITEFNQMIDEQALANKQLSEAALAAKQDADETQATMLVLNLQMNQAKTAILVGMFQMTKMCYLTEALGIDKQQAKRLQEIN